MRTASRTRPAAARPAASSSPRAADLAARATPPGKTGTAAAMMAALATAEGAPAVLAAVAPMTVKQFATFLMIAYDRRSHTVGSLAEKLATSPPVITRTLDRLEGMHLVSRSRSSADRRVVHLALTREGEDLARLIDQVMSAGLMRLRENNVAA